MDLILSATEQTFEQFSVKHLVAGMLIIMSATIIQYGVGIGFGLLAGPLLALLSIEFVPVPVLILTFITSASAAYAEWTLVKRDQLKFSVGGRVFGSIIAASLFSFLPDEKSFMLIFGIVVGLMVLISMVGFKFPFNLGTIGLAGFVSGFTATFTSVGGPPMAAVYQDQKASDARPTLQVFFALGSLSSLIILVIAGYVKWSDFIIAAFLLPGLIMGFYLAPIFRPFFDRNFRPWILGIALIAAILLIQRGLS